MILHCYALKDRKVGAFTVPQFDNHNPAEYVEVMRRALITAKDPGALSAMNDQDLYLIGTYDDNLGSFVPNLQFLADLREYLPKVDVNHHAEKETMVKEDKEITSNGEQETI